MHGRLSTPPPLSRSDPPRRTTGTPLRGSQSRGLGAPRHHPLRIWVSCTSDRTELVRPCCVVATVFVRFACISKEAMYLIPIRTPLTARLPGRDDDEEALALCPIRDLHLDRALAVVLDFDVRLRVAFNRGLDAGRVHASRIVVHDERASGLATLDSRAPGLLVEVEVLGLEDDRAVRLSRSRRDPGREAVWTSLTSATVLSEAQTPPRTLVVHVSDATSAGRDLGRHHRHLHPRISVREQAVEGRRAPLQSG